MRNDANRRTENPIIFLAKAERVVDLVLTYTDNIKRYPKKVRFSVSNPFLADALSLLELGNEFYDILVESEVEFMEKRTLQRRFLARVKRIEFWLRLSEKRGYLSAREVGIIANPLNDARNIVAHMYKKERSRYRQ